MSLLNEVYNEDFKDNNEKEFSKNKSKTYKNKNVPKKIKPEMIFKDDSDTSDNSDDESNEDAENCKLASFNPLPEKKNINNFSKNLPLHDNIKYQETNTDYLNEYYNNQSQNPNISTNQDLLKKLDNILHILEEEHEEKNTYITEELILYLFLGIFIIYVLDNFVKVGKYKR